jgi:dTDP-4-dehydrorhamnose reductase
VKKILIVGGKSLLSFNIQKYLKSKYYVERLSFSQIKKNKEYLLKFNFIINCTFNQSISNFRKTSDYLLAKFLTKKKITFVMISTCKVYGTNKRFPINEEEECFPVSDYGKKKFILEKTLKKLLKKRLLILRVSNLIQFDVRKNTKLKTFINTMLLSLKNRNRIYIPKNDFVKDFLPLNYFNLVLYKLIKNNITGIYNVGSGQSLKILEFAKLLIKGYGSGEIRKINTLTDNLMLNTNKLKKIIPYNISIHLLKKSIFKLGKELRNYE